MSDRLLIEEAKRRIKIFNELATYIRIIIKEVKNLDNNADIYLFGSVAEGKYTLLSDIDILIVTDVPPEIIISKLNEKGIEDPFEIHVINKDLLGLYQKRSKLIRAEDYKD